MTGVDCDAAELGTDDLGEHRSWAGSPQKLGPFSPLRKFAFALAVLAVISTHLPTALRIFLLTLAVVDDLIAIAIIAVFYLGEMQIQALAVLPMLTFT